MILIGGVIVNPFVCIAAAGIDGGLVLSLLCLTASPLLVHRAQDVEELADALGFRVPGDRIHLHKSRPHKAGLGGQIPGKPQGAHAPSITPQIQFGRKTVFGLLCR